MFLPPLDPSSIPCSSSSSVPPRKRLIILQSCEAGSKLRKLNDAVEEEDNAIQMESNITRAQDPQSGLMPHTAEPTPEEETRRVSAKGELNKLCSMRHWKAPVYECYEGGPFHKRVYLVKATIEVKEDSGTCALECFGNQQHKKKIAAEEAAEAALWYLKNVGYSLETDKASGRRSQATCFLVSDFAQSRNLFLFALPSFVMRRSASKKKSGQSNPADPIPSSTTDLFRSASSKATTKEMDRIDHLFNQYANKSSNLIDPEGIEELCSNLEVSHTDIRILMLAWKMKSEKQGYFTNEEWRRGLKALRADTINKLKKALPELEKEVRRQSNFADFYAYAFRYCLTEEKQKSIDIETICQLLDIVMGSTFRAQVDYFVEYLKIQNDYKVINMDQWMGFFRFCNEISFPEMTEYNPELAWPLVLDNFVEWIREKQA
ncbi:unnamed protein product [Microthlaspi erraticum]|uniref:Defective in cullin neddylation protein n=1 Tax=Microthlaspi erraticum TaxID=1685480 RepID=A0A6D2I866_9BRAS|nr:unnamed protein product [Microthlaspi erraticum]